MNGPRRQRLLSVAIAAAIAGCGRAPAPQSPTETTELAPASTAAEVATPSTSPLFQAPIDSSAWAEFVSARHLYTIRYPPGWDVIPATADAGPDTSESIDSPSFDRIRGDGFTFLGRSRAIPGDAVQLYNWIDAYVQRVRLANPGCYPPTDEWESIGVQGYYAGPWVTGCESIAVVGGPGHAWEFRLIGEPNHDLFSILLSWVDIDDESLEWR